MVQTAQTTAPSFESVWAILQETARRQEETDRQMKETDRRIKELQQTTGAWANNHGEFAEEYFFNSFDKGKKTFLGNSLTE